MPVTTPRPCVRAGTAAASTRARLARAHRMGDHDAIPALERQLKADIAAEFIRELVTGWPPLTDAQRADLAALLQGAL